MKAEKGEVENKDGEGGKREMEEIKRRDVMMWMDMDAIRRDTNGIC